MRIYVWIDDGSFHNYYCLSLYAEMVYKHVTHFVRFMLFLITCCYTCKKKCMSFPQNIQGEAMESCEALWKLNWEMRPEIARLTLIAVYKADLQFALRCLWKLI